MGKRTIKQVKSVNEQGEMIETPVEVTGPSAGLTDELKARFDVLFAERFYQKQTEADLWETVIRQGIKTLEKRREETKEAQIERARKTLAKLGAA